MSNDTVTIGCYLTLSATGPSYRPAHKVKVSRVSQKPPSLGPMQRALRLDIEVPRALFQTPQLAAQVRVPDEAVTAPTINAEVVTNIQELVQRELGVSMEISVLGDTEDSG